ncbi:hypothetical protein VKT23_007965 [Stygiomarasmius scandens]|uniref:Uncharacterized protein n=1 Tax=Marasmiellus scandens TaxID=2682957 RepID=A0ABR1JQ33_9AGAR
MASYWRRMRGYMPLQQDNDEHYNERHEEIPMSTFPTQTRFSRRSLTSPSKVFQIIRHHLSIRRALALIFAACFIMIAIVLSSGIPPRYDDIWAYEKVLPQHNLTAATVDVRLGKRKYLRFEGGVKGRGLNNVLQEALMMSYVAYLTDRAFVFEDYVWSLNSPFWSTVDEWALRPSRIPFNAFISGPTTGGPISTRGNAVETRSVSLEFFDQVCPSSARTTVSAAESPSDREGHDLVDWWVERLGKVKDDPCVVVDSSKEVFDIDFFGSSKHIISAFDSLRTSPILKDFSWSPLVLSAIPRNFAVLHPPDLKDLYDQSQNSTIKGLVAIHLRRGDFFGHCLYLLKWRVLYMGMNTYSGIPDFFDPEGYLRHHSEAEEKELNDHEKSRILKPYYFEHCLPEVDQIVHRLRSVREENPSLDLNKVYVLSNGKASWLNELAGALKGDGWGDVKSTLDLRLDSQQKYVSGAIDMAIAEKAEVFIGNGFSSLSSNIVMLRLAKGLPVTSNRLL